MYVCICHNITDKKLEETIIKSNGEVKEVLKRLGMGKSCGTCLIESIDKIKNQKSSKKSTTQVG